MSIVNANFQKFVTTSAANFDRDTMEAGTLYLVESEQTKNEIGYIAQYDVMPTATAETVEQIVQYVGITTDTYINGYFYRNTAIIENEETLYSWQPVGVQADSQRVTVKEDF